MELHGSLTDNLRSAVRSAERLRGHPIHTDTQNFWLELLSQARASLRSAEEGRDLEQLTGRLQILLSESVRHIPAARRPNVPGLAKDEPFR